MLEEIYSKKLLVKLLDGRQIAVKYKTRIDEVLNMLETPEKSREVYGVRVNNEVRSIDYEIVDDILLEYIYYNNNDGYRIYSRTAKFILYMAVLKLYPDLKIEYSNNMGCDNYFLIKEGTFSDEMAQNIKKEMQDIIKRDSDIFREAITSEEAEMLYESMKNTDYLTNIKVRTRSHMTMCFCENMCNYMNGVLAPSTGYIKNFDIKLYREGFVLTLPYKEDINKMPEEIEYNKLYDIFEKYDKYNDRIGISKVTNLNDSVIDGTVGTVIRASESLHERQIMQLVDKVDQAKDVNMILIAGPSSSGKTTFAQKLGDNLRLLGYNPIVISMDDYYKEREENFNKETGEYDFESVTSLDINLFNEQMKALTSGKEVELPKYNFAKGAKQYEGRKLKLKENDILLVEGIHALNDSMTKEVDDKYKFRVYIAPITTLNVDSYTKVSSTDTRMLRRIVRDYATRKVRVEETLEMWEKIRKGEEKNIYPFLNTADYIFNSSHIYEIGVIKTFAEPLLLQVDKDSKYFSEARRLYEFLSNFLPIETKDVPVTSIIREFIGNGSFNR